MLDLSLVEKQQRVMEFLDTDGVRLHRLLARLTLSEEAAGELVQELFVRLAGSKRFDRAADPAAYAYRAAMNLAFEWRGKSKRAARQGVDLDGLVGEDGQGVWAEAVRAEELAEVLDGLGRLSKRMREVLVMRYVEQESYEEIGRRLGRDAHSVRSIASKAMKRVRKILAVGKNGQVVL